MTVYLSFSNKFMNLFERKKKKKRQTVGFLDFETWEENTFNNPNGFMRSDVTFLHFMH